MNKIKEERCADLPYSLREAIHFLQACLDKIPEKYKSEAQITVEDDEVYISYYRDETEDEKAAREYRELLIGAEKYGDNIPDPVL